MKTKFDTHKLGKKIWYYIAVAASILVLAASVVTTVLILAKDDPFVNTPDDPTVNVPDDPKEDQKDEDNIPVVSTAKYVFPVESVAVLHNYGFYYNSTLHAYYEHEGMDFTCEEGTTVCAIADGVIESIYEEDILRGSEITVTHENGLKSVYTYVEANSGLKVGDSVKVGQAIGKVASASGEEYKDGAHLHLELYVNGKLTDPETVLPFEEK